CGHCRGARPCLGHPSGRASGRLWTDPGAGCCGRLGLVRGHAARLCSDRLAGTGAVCHCGCGRADRSAHATPSVPIPGASGRLSRGCVPGPGGRLAGWGTVMPTAIADCVLDLDCRSDQWGCTPRLDLEQFTAVRRRMVLDGFKWDPQVGDVGTLADFALALPPTVWPP